MQKRKKREISDIILDTVIYTIMIALVIVTLYPMWYVVVASFSNSIDIARDPGIMLWPKEFVLGAYQMVFENPLLMGAFKNSLFVLGVSLPINIVMTLLCGYFMASTGMMWKKPIVLMFMFTMFFNGGLIPNFLNIKDLGLYNSLWALILPSALSVYNAIICKTAIEGLPASVIESAYIDGANDLHIIFKIVMPLIKPTLAVLTLYYGVGHWNSWFNASVYLKDTELLPIQNIIRSILLANDQTLQATGTADSFNTYAETIKYAAIVITTVPVLCIYPFLQKYFTKGVMIGAVKG